MAHRDLEIVGFARDAEELGRLDEAAAILAEVEPDFRYVALRTRRRHPRPFFDDGAGDPYDEQPYEPEPLVDQRRRMAREWREIDWQRWQDPLRTGSFSAHLREIYSLGNASALAAQRHPLFDMLARENDGAIAHVTERLSEIAFRAPVSEPPVALMNPTTYAKVVERMRERAAEPVVYSGVRIVEDPNCPPGRAYLVNHTAKPRPRGLRATLAALLFKGDGED